MKMNRVLVSTVLIVTTVMSLPVYADNTTCPGKALPLKTEDQIITMITCELGGKVLRLSQMTDQAGNFEALLLLNGRVSTVIVDTETGTIEPYRTIGE